MTGKSVERSLYLVERTLFSLVLMHLDLNFVHSLVTSGSGMEEYTQHRLSVETKKKEQTPTLSKQKYLAAQEMSKKRGSTPTSTEHKTQNLEKSWEGEPVGENLHAKRWKDEYQL